MAVSPDGQLIVVGNAQGEMKLYTYEDFRLIHAEIVHSSNVSAVSISPDNTLILTADSRG
jgi:WD40 repeat protein